jgi:hypothetical protein
VESYQPPYEYVLDSSALFDLKRLYPEKVFPGVWEKFNELCEKKSIIAPREVLFEIQKGNDELLEWIKNYPDIFIEPTEEKEFDLIQQVLTFYPPEIITKNSTGRPWADPFVIACAKHYNIRIIQHEVSDPNQYKIPAIAKKLDIHCHRLVDFFDREGWMFISS